MRQKRLKHVNLDMMKDLGVITSKQLIELPLDKDVYLEIGSGKGQFITSLAKDNPNNYYIAMERNMSVCYRIVEKQKELNLTNLLVILGDSEHLFEYFSKHTIKMIYLNFSDPWPKDRHHKRRLTYPTYLSRYHTILVENGLIQFRTDHESLFVDSVEYFKKQYDLVEENYNYISNEYYTEYEEKKRKIGKIHQLIARAK